MTPKEMWLKAKADGRKDIMRWMRDMKRAGHRIAHYRGRFWYSGPSVTVGSIQDALSETKVKCGWDSMGLSVVVHPARGF